MALTIPPAANYPSPLVAVPTKYRNDPPEGPQLINCEIDWATMGGTSKCVNFNLQNNATLNFSQICAISVDNSQCGSDVTFTFPDTLETTTIPAYSPKVIVEVFTNQTQFYVNADSTTLSNDVTKFSILNTVPPPMAVPTSQEQNSASANNIAGNTAGSSTIVANTINGTIESAAVIFQSGGIAESFFTLQDGTGKVIAQGVGASASGFSGGLVLLLSNIAVRFSQGLVFVVATASGAAATYSVNVFYRTP